MCFRVNPGGLDEGALEALNRHVPARVFRDDRGFARRICMVNYATTWTDVRETLDLIARFGMDRLRDNGHGLEREEQ